MLNDVKVLSLGQAMGLPLYVILHVNIVNVI